MKIIGYQKAKGLMQAGRVVREVCLYRGGLVAFLGLPDGEDEFHVRADAWDRLRRECHLVDDYFHKNSKTRKVYVWSYGPKETCL